MGFLLDVLRQAVGLRGLLAAAIQWGVGLILAALVRWLAGLDPWTLIPLVLGISFIVGAGIAEATNKRAPAKAAKPLPRVRVPERPRPHSANIADLRLPESPSDSRSAAIRAFVDRTTRVQRARDALAAALAPYYDEADRLRSELILAHLTPDILTGGNRAEKAKRERRAREWDANVRRLLEHHGDDELRRQWTERALPDANAKLLLIEPSVPTADLSKFVNAKMRVLRSVIEGLEAPRARDDRDDASGP